MHACNAYTDGLRTRMATAVGTVDKDNRTRRHEVTLVKDKCRLDIRKHSFSQMTINEWNKLSTDCVIASSMNMFKNKDDTYLKMTDYTYINNVGLSISQWLPCV